MRSNEILLREAMEDLEREFEILKRKFLDLETENAALKKKLKKCSK